MGSSALRAAAAAAPGREVLVMLRVVLMARGRAKRVYVRKREDIVGEKRLKGAVEMEIDVDPQEYRVGIFLIEESKQALRAGRGPLTDLCSKIRHAGHETVIGNQTRDGLLAGCQQRAAG